jgi:hypothetical protein
LPSTRLAFVVLCFAVLVTMPARAQNPQSSTHAPVRYVVSLDNRPDHVVEVKIVLGPGASERDLQLRRKLRMAIKKEDNEKTKKKPTNYSGGLFCSMF